MCGAVGHEGPRQGGAQREQPLGTGDERRTHPSQAGLVERLSNADPGDPFPVLAAQQSEIVQRAKRK